MANPVVVRCEDKSAFKAGERLGLSPREGLLHRFNAEGQPIGGS